MSRPNVLLIHGHDLGRHLGCYGADVATPELDALAADGVRFDEHYVTAPQCSPSRGSLFTGKHPHEHGLVGLAHDRWELGDGERVLPQYLGDAGYETHLFGLQHLTEFPDELGYDRIHAEQTLTPDALPSVHEEARAASVADRVAGALRGGDLEAPFFASVGFFEAHRVKDDGYGFEPDRYDAPDPGDVSPLGFLPDEPGIRSDVAGLRGMVEATDDGVGTIRAALAEAGLAEETLLVFTTEHGLAFPRAKGTCYDPGIEAAFLLEYPGVIESQVRDELVSNVDVFATLLEIADVPIPSGVSGRSFAPLLELAGGVRADDVDWAGGDESDGAGDAAGDAYEPRDRIFAGMTWHDRYNPIRAIRTSRYKYVRNLWHLPRVHMTGDVFGSDAGAELRERYYTDQRPYEELYDLEADPAERENLAADDECADVRARLRDELREWMRETDDPLLDGPVVPADWDALAPEEW